MSSTSRAARRRIYEQFIEDRLRRSPKPFEKHHILPRSLGGSDAPSNIIKLSPEDHFFAHLLLAKAHGGMLWVPVVMWLGGERSSWKGRISRQKYGWAVRLAKAATSGRGAHQFDHSVYVLEHEDGRSFSGTQSEMYSDLGMSRAGANLLIKGKCPSMNGWYFPGLKPRFIGRGSRKGADHPMAVKARYHFRHRDGREFFGTPFEMQKIHGLSKAGASTLANGKRTISKGWYIASREPSTGGRAGAYIRLTIP
jgi:hypothetical protein